MKANRAYRLLVRRGGFGPAWLAGPNRSDRIEVVELDSGEVVLFWDTHPSEGGPMTRRLREDLANLEAEDFMERWAAEG